MQKSPATPLMQQYYAKKAEHHDTLLFFQVGDFYELFFDDAKKAAAYLGITLTARGRHNNEPIPLCGVPVHTKDHYIAKLIKGGYRVALCDQLEPATPGIVVKRGVTQVFTPATLTDTHMLDEKKASYLFSCFPDEVGCGLVCGELLTSQIQATSMVQLPERTMSDEVARLFPDEILMPNTQVGKQYATRLKSQGYQPLLLESPDCSDEYISNWLMTQFDSAVAQIVAQNSYIVQALRYFYAYMRRTHAAALDQFNQFTLYTPDQFLVLDAATQRNLEIIRNAHDGSVQHSLYATLDRTVTPMGSRLMRRWLSAPLMNPALITMRYDIVAYCVQQNMQTDELHVYIKSVGDIERIVGRIALAKAQLHDYLALKAGLVVIPYVKRWLLTVPPVLAQEMVSQLADFDALYLLLEHALYDEGTQDHLIKAGYDAQLDQYRATIDQITMRLQQFERDEQMVTGINSLKVGYNGVHGYYIEITNTHAAKVPVRYIRKQTLAGKERYVAVELQAIESEIQHAQALIADYEKQVYASVKAQVSNFIPALRRAAAVIAQIDVLLSYAVTARDNRYVRPQLMPESRDIQINDGRHPVVEQLSSERFIPNDVMLQDDQSTWIITGPNMGGKSTFLRQTALIQIMAQAGSFVPARAAQLPIIDRIFTRIGAGDNMAQGKSTFLVEMEETALICTQATARSLVILDEVGRGTSTYDGLAIARAVVEYLHTVVQARCLFATHYHELNELEGALPGIVSYHVTSMRTPAGIVFLYKVARGAADGSFGIEVARLASVPAQVITRARALLAELAQKEGMHRTPSQVITTVPTPHHDQVRSILKNIDPDSLSPRQAHDLLVRLKSVLDGE